MLNTNFLDAFSACTVCFDRRIDAFPLLIRFCRMFDVEYCRVYFWVTVTLTYNNQIEQT
jgi:hypothetical protein